MSTLVFGRRARRLAVAISAHLCLVAGCGGSSEEVLRSDMASLEQRVADLERASGRVQMELTSMEEDVLLLEDRVEAHRLSLERRGMVRARSRDELPRYAPPPVETAHTPPSLPVERVYPPTREEPAEILITNETLAAYSEAYGPGGSADWNLAGRSTSAPLPPVVTGDRLPTQTVDEPEVPAETAATEPSTASGVALYQESLRWFNAGNYSRALSGFEAFLEAAPTDDYRDNALYWIGECHYATGRFPEALASFQRVVRECPDGNKVPDSLLKIGLTYERLNNRSEASEVLSALVETYPMTDAARRASERLTELN